MRPKSPLLFLFGLIWISVLSAPSLAAKQDPEPPRNEPSTFGFYPDSEDGLRDFLQTIFDAMKREHSEDGWAHLNDRFNQILVIPGAKKWLASVYKPSAAREIAAAHRSTSPNLVAELERYDFDQLSEIKVTRVEFTNEQAALSSGIQFFVGMKNPVPIYTAYLIDRQGRIHLIWVPFVYVQRAFRVLGTTFWKVEDDKRPRCGIAPALQHLLLHPVFVDGQIMQQKLVDPKPPVLRPRASDSPGPRTLVLLIAVECDGSVMATEYVSGPLELYKKASEIARKWRYQITYMNGSPSEVLSTVTITLDSDPARSDSSSEARR